MPESMNNHDIAGTSTETPKFSIENEGGDCKEEILNSKKDKQKFWMVGALSSIAIAGVAVCILGFAGKNGSNQSRHNIQFQLYTDEKFSRCCGCKDACTYISSFKDACLSSLKTCFPLDDKVKRA